MLNYSVAVVFGEKLYRLSLEEGKNVTMADKQPADLVLPGFGHRVMVSAENGGIRVSDTPEKEAEKTASLHLNTLFIVDDERRIALCAAPEIRRESTAILGEAFSISAGRSAESRGICNDIVLSGLPFVSRLQFRMTRRDGKTVIRDCDSTNGTFVNGQKITETELQPGDEISVYTLRICYEGGYLRFENLPEEPVLSRTLRGGERSAEPHSELFQRSPRIQERMPGGKIEIPAPPEGTSKPEINWLSTLLPAVVTVAIAVTMALAFDNSMMMLYSLPMTVAGVIVSIVNYLRGSKNYKKSLTERSDIYLKKLSEIEAEITEKREAQKRAMLLADPSPQECLVSVANRSISLWSRKPEDSDFVSVRLGTGTVPFSVQMDRPREQMMEGDELKKKPGEIFNANRSIQDMPVLCDIRDCGVVGVVGTPERTGLQLQNMIYHLAAHHCSSELKLVCFCGEEQRGELAWLADLPHTHGESAVDSYLAFTQDEADALFRSFAETFAQRKQEAQENSSYGNELSFVPFVLFVFFEPKLLKKSDPINRWLFMERGLGAGCLMAGQKLAQLPKQCTQIITIGDGQGEMYNTARASERQIFKPDHIPAADRETFGRLLRPLYCDEGIAGSSLPGSFTLFQMLGVDAMADFDIGQSWKRSDMLSSKVAPSAPVGVLENGELLYFNSPPTGDNGGAHALVAGTTGSGKSEALLSLVLSLALRYPPDEVSFLVIDFKGDSIAGKLTGLPHLRGVITNLDGDELRRSLVSIGAENKRRLRLFKEYNESHPEEKKKISDIRDYMEKYRQGRTGEPLPHLFIVVDEFAEMKKQMPDIMDQFLSVAQIGRSLGVHLILATQSPTGVVDGKIRANIFKQLCLKTANTGESRDMLGTDLAARIKNPGRAYLKVDDDLQLFQSAYGGGKLRLADGSESTQLREAVDAIAAYCRSHQIRKLPDVFCPPVPELAEFPAMNDREEQERPFGLIPIGLRDDPAEQFLGGYDLDVFSRNTLIVGSQMTGKTNLLQVILRGAAELYSPQDLNVYILDFSSLFMKVYEALPHVGGVATRPETEKITNLFRLLQEQIELRRQKFVSLGVSTFAAYRESGARDLAQILLLVDDLAAAKNYFPVDADPLLAICKEGLALGISVVATATMPVGGMSYLPTFAARIALYNNDVTVYNTLLGHTSLRPKEIPGRCLVPLDNGVFECQCYQAFAGDREIDRTGAIRAFCSLQTALAGGKRAAPIPFIPKDLSIRDAVAAFPEAYRNGRFMFGLDYATVKPLSVRLSTLGLLAVSGREKDVRNFQRCLISSAELAEDRQTEFYIVDGIERSLQAFADCSCVAEYSFLPEQAVLMLSKIRETVEDRYARIAGGDVSALDTAPVLVLMLNSAEAIQAVASDKKALESWNALTGRLRSMNVCLLLGNLDNVSIPFGNEVLKKLKDDRKLMFFDDLGNLKIGDLPYSTVKKFAGGLHKGDGYLILGNEAARIRVPDCPETEGR